MHQSIKLTMKVCYRLSAAKEELAEPAGGNMFINRYILSQDSVMCPSVTIQIDRRISQPIIQENTLSQENTCSAE